MKNMISFIVLFTASTSLHAQADIDAQPRGAGAGLLAVKTSSAILRPRCTHFTRNCFRIFMQIRPKGRAAVNIAAAVTPNGAYLYETTAYSSSGVTCEGQPISGLPRGWPHNGEFNWGSEDQPFEATAKKPGILIAEFTCDGAITPNDSVTVQFTLLADVSGRGPTLQRFTLLNIPIKFIR